MSGPNTEGESIGDGLIGLSKSADPANRQDLDTSAQDPGACSSSMGSNITDLSARRQLFRYGALIRRSWRERDIPATKDRGAQSQVLGMSG